LRDLLHVLERSVGVRACACARARVVVTSTYDVVLMTYDCRGKDKVRPRTGYEAPKGE